MWLRERFFGAIPGIELCAARGEGQARRPRRCHTGDSESRERFLRGRTAHLRRCGTGFLVETLLERGAEGDWPKPRQAIDRLANLPADDGSAMLEITLLRLRALLARARGDDVAYRDLASRYREMAKSLGFEGHIELAEAMP